MQIQIRKAERFKSKLRLALAGPSGAGKTMSGLKIAKGIAGVNGKVCMIDTERGSGDLYAHLFDYDIITLEPPFKPDNYVDAIHAAEKAGYDVIVLDSLSHAWSDEGGLLDQADRMQASGKNRFTMWADLTPQHRKLVNAMLNSTSHIVATMRSKQEYTMEKETDRNGNERTTVKKVGLAPVQRDGMEYEFTVFMDIDQGHNARATKDRTDLFKNEVFVIDEKTGERILAWLNSGKVNVKELKQKIVDAARWCKLDHKDREFRAKVETIVELPLVEENFEEILKRLNAHGLKMAETEGEQKNDEQPKGTPLKPGYLGSDAADAVGPGEGNTTGAPQNGTAVPGTAGAGQAAQ